MIDIPVVFTLLLSIATLSLYLLPRWHKRRNILIPGINKEVSVVGPLRTVLLRVLLFLVYGLLFLIIFREIYITRSCETHKSFNILTIALQSRFLRIMSRANVPIWADGETLIDYLYTTQPVPKWKSYQTFSTLWISEDGLNLIQQLLSSSRDQLWTVWYPKTETLRVGWVGTDQIYIDLVFWHDIFEHNPESRLLTTSNPDFDLNTVHFYEIFPLHLQEPRGYPALTAKLQGIDQPSKIRKDIHQLSVLGQVDDVNGNIFGKNNENKKNDDNTNNKEDIRSQFAMIGIPNMAHQIALRSWGDLSHDNEMRSQGTRDQCMMNLLQGRFIAVKYTDAMINELKRIGYLQ
jgi:hypothetical protein